MTAHKRLGCTVIPISGGMTERQLQLITDFQPDAIMVTPSYMLTLLDAMESAGLDPRSTSLRTGVFGAEPWTEQMRTELEGKLDINAVDIYGLSEVITFSRPRHGSPHTSSAQARWRAVNARPHVTLVRAGARFEEGVLVEWSDESGDDEQVA